MGSNQGKTDISENMAELDFKKIIQDAFNVMYEHNDESKNVDFLLPENLCTYFHNLIEQIKLNIENWICKKFNFPKISFTYTIDDESNASYYKKCYTSALCKSLSGDKNDFSKSETVFPRLLFDVKFHIDMSDYRSSAHAIWTNPIHQLENASVFLNEMEKINNYKETIICNMSYPSTDYYCYKKNWDWDNPPYIKLFVHFDKDEKLLTIHMHNA